MTYEEKSLETKPSKRALLICHGDSFIRPSLGIERELVKTGYACDWFLCEFGAFKPETAEQQLSELGFDRPYRSGLLAPSFALDDRYFAEYDLLIAALPGGEFRRLAGLMERWFADTRPTKRPILTTFYNGVAYENAADGAVSRMSADVHCVNGTAHAELVRRTAEALGLDANNVILSGLPAIDRLIERAVDAPRPSSEDIVFAAQPTVPRRPEERRHLMVKLAELAESQPSRTVYFRPRQRSGEHTMHRHAHYDEPMFDRLAKDRAIPENFVLTYEPLVNLLEQCRACLTVSSTAAFEALAIGRDVALVSDFGLPDKYGAQLFLGSGLYCSLDRLKTGDWPKVDPDWLSQQMISDGGACKRIVAAADELVEQQRALDRPIPMRRGFVARKEIDEQLLPGVGAPRRRRSLLDRFLVFSVRSVLGVPGVRPLLERVRRAMGA